MVVGRCFHHLATLALLGALGFLVVTDVSTPVVKSIPLFSVSDSSSSINFGTLGYCIRTQSDHTCSKTALGYSPADVIQSTFRSSNVDFPNIVTIATKVMVLHPVATVLIAIALFFSLSDKFCISLLAMLTSAAGFAAAVTSVVLDYLAFAAVKAILANSGFGVSGDFRVAAWTLLAATIMTFIAWTLLFFTCCNRRKHRRDYYPKTE